MNDEDIKKALECCLETRHDCSDCLLEKEVYCTSVLHKNILDLINRQQAKIDDLKRDTVPKLQDSLNRANKYGIEVDCENTRLQAEIEQAKSEAIKECVNKYTEMLIDEYHLRTDLQIAGIKRLEQKVLSKMAGEQDV